MAAQSVTGSIRTFWKITLIASAVVVYLIINVFEVGGDAFVINLNNNIVGLLALVVTILAMLLWRQVGVGSRNRLLWGGLAIGWALWTVAEFYWGIAAWLGQEVPYPSWADLFWVVGYIPMCVALWTRIRDLPKHLSWQQRAAIWLAGLVSIGWTVWFVILPVIQTNDPAARLQGILNVLYPVLNLVLLVMVFRIFFAYQKGIYGRAWAWLSAGIALNSLAGLTFSYATTVGLYYPDGTVNLLSTLGSDVPYNISYLLWLVGLLHVRNIQKTHRIIEGGGLNLAVIADAHLVIYTRHDNVVIDVSRNYPPLFPLEKPAGKPLGKVLGMPDAEVNALQCELIEHKVLKERTVPLITRLGQRSGGLSGIAVISPEGEFDGSIFLLRLVSGDDSLDDLLTDYQLAMVASLLQKTGTGEKEEGEIKDLLVGYHRAYLRAFYNRILTEGGSLLGDAFLTELRSKFESHPWQMRFDPQNLVDVSALSLAEAQQALPLVVESARQMLCKITDETTTNAVAQDVQAQFDPAVLNAVARLKKS